MVAMNDGQRIKPPQTLADTPYRARLKRLRPTVKVDPVHGQERGQGPAFRAICGFASPDGQSCPATIGLVYETDSRQGSGVGDFFEALRAIGAYPWTHGSDSGWLITAPPEFPGFIPRNDGFFEVVRPRRERDRNGAYRRRWHGRRDLPDYLWETAMRSDLLSAGDALAAQRDILGWVAALPTVVKCPRCGRLSHVNLPSA